jgi:dihydrofolate reductase
MAKLIYSAITSLDGYIADQHGRFDWGEPDEELHSFINDLQRTTGTYLYGRKLYEVMVAWETMEAPDGYLQEFAEVWQAADKVVYSRSLASVSSARTRIEREFDPQAVQDMKEAADRDITVGGPDLASHAFAAGIVDEVLVFLAPIAVGGGKRCFPDDARLQLELVDQRRFAGGVAYLHYRVRDAR